MRRVDLQSRRSANHRYGSLSVFTSSSAGRPHGRASVEISDVESARKTALRGERWLAASDSACWDGSPLDAAAEEEPSPVVVEVAVAVADAADLLDEQVDGFGRSVGGAGGGVEGEGLVAPPVNGAGEATERLSRMFAQRVSRVMAG